LTGEVIKSTRDSIRQGFLDWSPRLLLAMYSCEIQASAEVLGRVYAVITRRRGKIISESLLEPSPNFTILALLPVAESFGFSDEIRKRTSGAASPQLIFEGFEMLDEDPFWVPRTEEEIEDLGEKGDRENVAKRYVDTVRERKGLFVQRKVVEHGEKQKTLKR
jgi:ribosome assembly protein 1